MRKDYIFKNIDRPTAGAALLLGAIHVVILLLDSKIIWRESGPLPLLHNCVRNSKIEL